MPSLDDTAKFVGCCSSCATTVAVFILIWQIILARIQASTQFEDSLSREYRDLAQELPTQALLSENLTPDEQAKKLDEFYHYIDLTNEQVFLRQRGRIRKNTWLYWRDGIRSNLKRPAFEKAWVEIETRDPHSFSELKRLEMTEFADDPRSWEYKSRRFLKLIDMIVDLY
jgi:hypothetical protein